MNEFLSDLRVEAVVKALLEIKDAVGLDLSLTTEWATLRGPHGELLARIPSSNDPIGDIDKIRRFWFQTSERLSNELWD